MLQFLQYKTEKRYVNFKNNEPLALFLDRSDAMFYSQYYPLYGMEEVQCVILPPCGYEDESDHDLSAVRILLKKTPTEEDPRTQAELWCSDGLAEAFLYAYAYHTACGGKKENFEATLTSVDFFAFDDDYDGNVQKVPSTPFLTDILSHANENNYPLALALLELCISHGIQDTDGLLKVERGSFTYPDRYVADEDEQIAIIEPQAHYYLVYELFTEYGFQANGCYEQLYKAAKNNRERKTALILLYMIRSYPLCFPTLAYEMIINEEYIPHPQKNA